MDTKECARHGHQVGREWRCDGMFRCAFGLGLVFEPHARLRLFECDCFYRILIFLWFLTMLNVVLA
jgi:hypothetical protein